MSSICEICGQEIVMVDLAYNPAARDAPMCDEHTTRLGANTDFCPLHKPKESQPALFGPEAA
jgi:hypothetical protein